MIRTAMIILIFILGICKGHAQTDPVLSGMIVLYTDKAEKQLKSQEKVMLMQTTGHIWTKEEVEATTDFQRQFNDYLDSFRSVISYAAQIYGFYHEIGKLTENMGSLSRQLEKSPENALAVALTPRRSSIYRELILGGIDIVNDIRLVCLSDMKMTEKERIEILFGIRPKLRLLNRSLCRLTLAVKYTSLSDVWREIDCRAKSYDVDKWKITDEAFERWRSNSKIRPRK
ncbi:hypothetical protein [uncultured Duncaniella sp.]|uniref:hypothetical protein n=1 Tax=uncultured Duncaniella sp. TaxID=2768039 RepID=UPI0025AFB600|nr:hypothetical protein [uncultured Duncaniella sp.]